jgi:prepilin-type N-terminal cleavage/methylation domain-containing protein
MRARGFTLVELMMVVALFGVMAALGAYAIAGTTRAQETAALSRSIQFALLQARADAVGDGYQRRLNCSARSCTEEMATSPGMGTPAGWKSAGSTIVAGRQGQVWAVDAATEIAQTNPAGPIAQSAFAVFYPDGTAAPSTVYVCDQGCVRHYKVYVFSATGMAHLVDRW